MSKLLERLERIAKGASRSLGFAPPGNQEAIAPLALLASLEETPPGSWNLMSKAPLDALVLPASALEGEPADQRLEGLTDAVWGVSIEGSDLQRLQAYQGKGCDFVVFGIEGTKVAALEEGECARVLRVSQDLEETQLRGLEDLPVDIILLRRPSPQGPLSLEHLLAISNIRSASSRYLLLEWDTDLTAMELGNLRDLGVDGLVIPGEPGQITALKSIRERIQTLPRRKTKGEQKAFPVLPRAGALGDARPRRHEEEEEEEEWDEP